MILKVFFNQNNTMILFKRIPIGASWLGLRYLLFSALLHINNSLLRAIFGLQGN